MKVDGALVTIAVIIMAGIGGFLYLYTAAPNGTPDAPTMALFLSIFLPTVSGLLAAWRANQAVQTALDNKRALEYHNEDVTEKLTDLERKTNGGLTARLNEQTRILLDRDHRRRTGGVISPNIEGEDDWHARQQHTLRAIQDAEDERLERRLRAELEKEK